MELAKLRQDVDGEIRQKRIIIDESDLSFSGLFEFSDLLKCVLVNTLDGSRPVHIDFAGIGENHLAPLAQKELCAEALLDALELSADRGL